MEYEGAEQARALGIKLWDVLDIGSHSKENVGQIWSVEIEENQLCWDSQKQFFLKKLKIFFK